MTYGKKLIIADSNNQYNQKLIHRIKKRNSQNLVSRIIFMLNYSFKFVCRVKVFKKF